MIEVHNTYGCKVFLAPAAIVEVIEASTSSQWHGIKAYIRTFDGRTIEVTESASEIARMLSAQK